MTRAAVVSRIAHDAAERPRLLAGEGPWWSRLDPAFARADERFDLGAWDRARVGATAASDVVLRTLGASLVGALALPIGYHPLALRRALREREAYARFAEAGDAHAFFARPPRRGVAIETRAVRTPFVFRPRGGVVEDLVFESPFAPVLESARREYLRHAANRRAHARWFRHEREPRPTVIAIHGFSADLYHVNEWFFSIPWLFESGYDVLLVTLPFHGPRQTRFSPFSGHGFFAGGVGRINEAFAQAIFDLRIYVDHLFAVGVPRVGVTGVSLGGMTSALLATVEDRLSFAIPNVPVASIPDLVLEWEPIGTALRAAMAVTRTSMADARLLVAASCPLTYAPVLPRDRLFVIGGVGDRLAPPKHARVLREHWGECRMHWFPGSHLVHLDRGKYFRQIRLFLESIAFAP